MLQIRDRDFDRASDRDALDRRPIRGGVGGTQNLVTAHDNIQAFLIEEPKSFLGKR
jgi:hypothetical protein